MAKGNLAKEEVIKKIAEAFGDDYIGINDKKVYVQAKDGANGKVQIALTLTCPKVGIPHTESAIEISTDLPWDNNYIPGSATAKETKATEVTQEEKEYLSQLLETLGL